MLRSFLIISCCITLGYLFASCSGPKKIVTVPPEVKVEKKLFDPATYFDVSALRLFNMARLYPNTLQKRMQTSSLDSLQIKITRIAKSTTGTIQFQEDLFQPMRSSVVEPGMMGKIVLAMACVKKMQDYRLKDISYATTMIVESAGKNLPGAYNDPYSPQGKPSIGQYLRRMLMYNDVEAYNRIFELVTKDQINDFLKVNGWNATAINSRLGRFYTAVENGSMNLINFYDGNNRKIFTQPNTIASNAKGKTGFINTTSITDMESILLTLFTDKNKEAELSKQIGEEQLEYLKVLLLNPQDAAQHNEGSKVNGSSSLIFPKFKPHQKLLVVPVKTISEKGMTEVVYYNDLNTGKSFVLSCSLLFKSYNGEKGFEQELKEGKQFFADLGNAALNQP